MAQSVSTCYKHSASSVVFSFPIMNLSFIIGKMGLRIAASWGSTKRHQGKTVKTTTNIYLELSTFQDVLHILHNLIHLTTSKGRVTIPFTNGKLRQREEQPAPIHIATGRT